MSFSRPIQWYHSYVDPIWPDSTFKYKMKKTYPIDRLMLSFFIFFATKRVTIYLFLTLTEMPYPSNNLKEVPLTKLTQIFNMFS